MNTLILGGYGNFGARIARALAADREIGLLIGGRDAQRAAGLAARLGGHVRGVAIDVQDSALSRSLRELRVDLVIHTAGPFQVQRYDVALACAAVGAHYIDLADGRRFVCDFASHADAVFRAADRCAISGASTVPALSSAVVDELTRGWQHIAGIEICIAPAQTAPRGVATMAAVLGYCGEPVAVWRAGQWQSERGDRRGGAPGRARRLVVHAACRDRTAPDRRRVGGVGGLAARHTMDRAVTGLVPAGRLVLGARGVDPDPHGAPG